MTRALVSLFATVATIVAPVAPLAAQTTRPAPGYERPVRPDRPQRPDRPVPLPSPVRPEIQPPRPGRPEIQPPRPVYPPVRPPVRPNPGGGYAGTLRCDSRGGQLQRCRANTNNRVILLRRHSGTCTAGRSWGYDRRSIWVSRNCRATFAYGYGSQRPNPGGGGGGGGSGGGGGPSTGLVIGGVAVAAGLLALLAANRRGERADSERPTDYPPGPPATISADLASLPPDSRPSMQTCLFEASRQIGVTGGTRLRFDRLVSIEPGNGGWRFSAETTATYPDGQRSIPFYCRATPTQVVQLDFTTA